MTDTPQEMPLISEAVLRKVFPQDKLCDGWSPSAPYLMNMAFRSEGETARFMEGICVKGPVRVAAGDREVAMPRGGYVLRGQDGIFHVFAHEEAGKNDIATNGYAFDATKPEAGMFHSPAWYQNNKPYFLLVDAGQACVHRDDLPKTLYSFTTPLEPEQSKLLVAGAELQGRVGAGRALERE